MRSHLEKQPERSFPGQLKSSIILFVLIFQYFFFRQGLHAEEPVLTIGAAIFFTGHPVFGHAAQLVSHAQRADHRRVIFRIDRRDARRMQYLNGTAARDPSTVSWPES